MGYAFCQHYIELKKMLHFEEMKDIKQTKLFQKNVFFSAFPLEL